jgi:hypothetical protein
MKMAEEDDLEETIAAVRYGNRLTEVLVDISLFQMEKLQSIMKLVMFQMC